MTSVLKDRATPHNPLGIIALFVFFIEAIATVSLKFVVSTAFVGHLVWFIILYPTFIAVAFFALLWTKREALYSPADFREDTTFKDILLRDVTSNLADAQRDVTQRIKAAIKEHLQGIDQDVASAVSAKVLNDIQDTFKTLKLEAAAAAQLAESPVAPLEPSVKREPLHPGAPLVVRWMSRNEDKYPFFSIKFMRGRIFRADGVGQQGLQFCIENGLVELYDVPNPKDANHPVTACRLNHGHATVRQILA